MTFRNGILSLLVALPGVAFAQCPPILTPSPVFAPNPITRNLLVHPGAESGFTSWGGAYESGVETGNVHSGLNAFTAGPNFSSVPFNTDVEMQQTIDLSKVAGISAADLAAGDLVANLSFWYGDQIAYSGSSGRVHLFLTTGTPTPTCTEVELKLTTNPNSSAPALAWTNAVGSIAIPPRTQYINYIMGFLPSGPPSFTNNTVIIDDNVLTISRRPLTSNLLLNPGAESGALTHWFARNGATPAAPVNAATYFGPGDPNAAHSGNYMFYGGSTPNAYVSQTVALSSVAGIALADVDAGLLTADYGFWYADKNGGTDGAEGRITLGFFDANLASLGQMSPSELRGTTSTYPQSALPASVSVNWLYETGTFPIPPATRSIVYTMDFNGGSSANTGVFDDNVLTISRR